MRKRRQRLRHPRDRARLLRIIEPRPRREEIDDRPLVPPPPQQLRQPQIERPEIDHHDDVDRPRPQPERRPPSHDQQPRNPLHGLDRPHTRPPASLRKNLKPRRPHPSSPDPLELHPRQDPPHSLPQRRRRHIPGSLTRRKEYPHAAAHPTPPQSGSAGQPKAVARSGPNSPPPRAPEAPESRKPSLGWTARGSRGLQLSCGAMDGGSKKVEE